MIFTAEENTPSQRGFLDFTLIGVDSWQLLATMNVSRSSLRTENEEHLGLLKPLSVKTAARFAEYFSDVIFAKEAQSRETMEDRIVRF